MVGSPILGVFLFLPYAPLPPVRVANGVLTHRAPRGSDGARAGAVKRNITTPFLETFAFFFPFVAAKKG